MASEFGTFFDNFVKTAANLVGTDIPANLPPVDDWVQSTPGGPGGVGPQGPQGPKGEKGDQGIQGPPGPPGPRGEQGIQGNMGQTGPAGSTGNKGEKGDTGEKGEKGDRGTDGAMGPPGTAGSNGTDGTNGKDGKDGKNGVDGQDGAAGPAGPAGPPANITMRGTWNGSVADYKPGDVVVWTDSSNKMHSYFYDNAATAGSPLPPETPGTPWDLFVMQGAPGVNGADGESASIGPNGNWFVGSFDTGVLADLSGPLDGKQDAFIGTNDADLKKLMMLPVADGGAPQTTGIWNLLQRLSTAITDCDNTSLPSGALYCNVSTANKPKNTTRGILLNFAEAEIGPSQRRQVFMPLTDNEMYTRWNQNDWEKLPLSLDEYLTKLSVDGDLVGKIGYKSDHTPYMQRGDEVSGYDATRMQLNGDGVWFEHWRQGVQDIELIVNLAYDGGISANENFGKTGDNDFWQGKQIKELVSASSLTYGSFRYSGIGDHTKRLRIATFPFRGVIVLGLQSSSGRIVTFRAYITTNPGNSTNAIIDLPDAALLTDYFDVLNDNDGVYVSQKFIGPPFELSYVTAIGGNAPMVVSSRTGTEAKWNITLSSPGSGGSGGSGGLSFSAFSLVGPFDNTKRIKLCTIRYGQQILLSMNYDMGQNWLGYSGVIQIVSDIKSTPDVMFMNDNLWLRQFKLISDGIYLYITMSESFGVIKSIAVGGSDIPIEVSTKTGTEQDATIQQNEAGPLAIQPPNMDFNTGVKELQAANRFGTLVPLYANNEPIWYYQLEVDLIPSGGEFQQETWEDKDGQTVNTEYITYVAYPDFFIQYPSVAIAGCDFLSYEGRKRVQTGQSTYAYPPYETTELAFVRDESKDLLIKIRFPQSRYVRLDDGRIRGRCILRGQI